MYGRDDKKWRRIFMMMGAKFEWFCVEVKHYNCFNQLSNDESFICWDSTKRDVWVRRPPSFAIRSHKLLRPRIDAYQDFLPRTMCIRNYDGRDPDGRIVAAIAEYRHNDARRKDHDEQEAGISDL